MQNTRVRSREAFSLFPSLRGESALKGTVFPMSRLEGRRWLTMEKLIERLDLDGETPHAETYTRDLPRISFSLAVKRIRVITRARARAERGLGISRDSISALVTR